MIDKFKKFKWWIIGIIVVLLFNSNFVMFNLVDKIDSATSGKFHLGYIRNYFIKGVESFNPFVGKYALDRYDLPIFNIELNQKAVNKLSNMLEKSKETLDFRGLPYSSDRNKVWVKAKLDFNHTKYKIKLSFQGTDSINFRNDKKSLSIKFSKKKLFNHSRRLGLRIVEEASIPTIFSYKLQEWLNGFKVNSYFVRIKINGIDQGLYLLEEKLQKSLLEKNNLAGVDVIKPLSEWDTQYGATHEIPFNWNLANTKLSNISKKDVGQYVQFEKLYRCKSYKCMKQYIDEKRLVDEEALRILFSSFHAIVGDNQKLLYNTATARMWIYFRTEDELERLPYFFDSEMYGANEKYKNLFIYYLGFSDEFRVKRDKVLWKFVKHRDKIVDLYDKIYNKNIGAILADSNHYTNGRFIENESLKKRSNLIANLDILKKYLSYNRVFSYVKFLTPKSFEFVVSADSNSPLKIKDIKFDYTGDKNITITYKNKTIHTTFDKLNNYFLDKNFMLKFDKNYKPIENRHHFIIKTDANITGYKVVFVNDITKKIVPKHHNFTKFIKYTPFIKNEGDKVLDGYYEFNKTHYFNNLTIKAGSVIKLAPKVSILSNNLTILGTKEKKVVIGNLVKNKPFGVIGVRGYTTNIVKIDNLELYGGKDAVLNGSYYSGGLSIYNSKKVIVKNSFIHDNSADDGMNIKYSQIYLENNIFNGNKADQVDLDICKGVIKNNKFIKTSIKNSIHIEYDDNGDGLDLSGSKVVVVDNLFNGFLDKGISVGENTKLLVYKNRFINNRSAITAKDTSKVYFTQNFYKDNKINIEMYQKKQIFGYPNVFVLNETHLPSKIVIKKHQGSLYILDKNISLDENLDVFKKLEGLEWLKKF